MQLLRLSGRKVCERVKQKGFLWKGKHINARYLHGAPRHLKDVAVSCIYVGSITSTKLDKSAVKRNRMRRRCREALRISLKLKPQTSNLTPSYQLLLLPRSSSLSAPFDEILSDVERLLSHLTDSARR